MELLASGVDELELSLDDFAAVSVVDSDDLESLVDLVSELSLLELLLFS